MTYKMLLSILISTIILRFTGLAHFNLHPNLILLAETVPFIIATILLRRVAAAHQKPYGVFWNMLAWGSAFFAAASLSWIGYDLLMGVEAPIPSIGDVFWSLQNITYVAALVYLLMRDRSIYRSIRFLFDTAMVLMVVGALSWEYIIRPSMVYFLDTTGFWGVLITTMYPISDLAMMICLFMLYSSSRFPYARDVFLCISAGMTIFIFSDTIYLSQVVSGHYMIGNWVDPLYSITILLFVIAGIRSVRTGPLQLPDFDEKARAPALKYILPYLLLAMLLVLAASRIDLQTPDIIVAASLMTVLLIIVRQVLILLENNRLMQKLQQALGQAEYLALYDPLSKLPNRRYFELQAAQALEHVAQEQTMAVLFMDLDRFKSINDSHGHDVGDALIRGVGERIRALSGEQHFAARIGGDEFIILCRAPQTERELRRFARRIIEEIARPFELGDIRLSTKTSIGIAMSPLDGTSVTELLKKADIALYRAKGLGRGQAVFYTDPGEDEADPGKNTTA